MVWSWWSKNFIVLVWVLKHNKLWTLLKIIETLTFIICPRVCRCVIMCVRERECVWVFVWESVCVWMSVTVCVILCVCECLCECLCKCVCECVWICVCVCVRACVFPIQNKWALSVGLNLIVSLNVTLKWSCRRWNDGDLRRLDVSPSSLD